jgi:hypothetical protein
VNKRSSILAILFAALIPTTALADSSGNFSATGTSATCVATPALFDANAGGFVGSTLSGGTSTLQFSTQVQTPNGQGTTLLIRPSMTTGLFTSTKLTTTINNATADVGIMVCVYVDPKLTAHGDVLNAGLPVNPQNCVVYDQRIQQVSNTLFANLISCAPTTTACMTNSDCASLGANYSCVSGSCQQNCSFDILQTTLSAHGFDFVAPVGNGTHNVVMTWGLIGQNQSTAGGSTAACVGPVTMTVQQVKNFSNAAPISFTAN